MALGLDRFSLESDLQYKLKGTGGILDNVLAERAATAIAEAIEKNNARIEEQLKAAGVSISN